MGGRPGFHHGIMGQGVGNRPPLGGKGHDKHIPAAVVILAKGGYAHGLSAIKTFFIDGVNRAVLGGKGFLRLLPLGEPPQIQRGAVGGGRRYIYVQRLFGKKVQIPAPRRYPRRCKPA